MNIIRGLFFSAWFLLWAGGLTYRICTRNWKEVKSYAKWAVACIALSLFLDIIKAPEWIYYILLLGYIVLDSKLKHATARQTTGLVKPQVTEKSTPVLL